MIDKILNTTKFNREDGIFFFCDSCNDQLPVIAEYWHKDSDGPSRIELISYNISPVELLVEKGHIQSKLDTEEYIFHYCGRYGGLIDKGLDIEFLNVFRYFKIFSALKEKN